MAHYLQQHGYRIVPVNPKAKSRTILGEPVFGSLDEACAAVGTIDVVDVFREPVLCSGDCEGCDPAEDSLLWLQEGVVHDEAAGWAEADGIGVVMDRCMLKAHAAWSRDGGQGRSVRNLAPCRQRRTLPWWVRFLWSLMAESVGDLASEPTSR